MTQDAPLTSPATPNLPLAPKGYEERYHDQNNNVLRLYFNQLKNLMDQLVLLAQAFQEGNYGQTIKFPNIGAYYYPEQYATGSNTPTIVLWNATSSLYGFTLNPNNTATAAYAGTYKITYSIELANNDNLAHDAIFWLRINGNTSAADLAHSTTIFTVPARKSVGAPTYTCAYSEIVFDLEAGDSVGLWWGTEQAASSGGATGIWLYSKAQQTTPMPYPETPSAIGSITFVSALPPA
jgi:hypothetical protein